MLHSFAYLSGVIASHRACGKLILLGEHFVVHGTPALAVPITSVTTTVSVVEDAGAGGVRLDARLDGATRETAERLLAAAVANLALDPATPWRVVVASGVPMGYGLGSSAAFSVALVGALARAAGRDLPRDELNRQAHALECIVHGTPSGIDDTVITWERAVQFRRGEPFTAVAPARPLTLVLAATARIGTTFEAVAGVRALRDREPVRFSALLDAASRIARAGIDAFVRGDAEALGPELDANHALLREVGVSTPALDALVAAARRAGAHGAKMTGGGLGGFVVALADPARASTVAGALRAAGADPVLETEVAP